MKKMIGVIGLWHLGCVLCASWSKLGNRVIGFDYDSTRVEELNRGIPPLYEPDLPETIQEMLAKETLAFSNAIGALSGCDFIFLSYDTPVLEDDSSDTSILEKSVMDVRDVMKDDAILVVSSQSPVGFCTYLRKLLREKNGSLDLAYSPENLRLGEAINCYLNPGRIILGAADNNTGAKTEDLLSQIGAGIINMNLESAEMVKHGINSFLATSIVFANSIADICETTGARIDDVVSGMKSDPRIGQKAYLAPGIGFSGGTLGRDLKVLDKKNTEDQGYAKLFGLIHKLNYERKYSILRHMESVLGTLENKTIGILGITYKPGTSTLRRSIPLEIVDLLLERKCNVKVFDPRADYSELQTKPRFAIASGVADASQSADILVLLTEWNEFKEFDWKTIPGMMNQPLFFDTKNVLDEKAMASHGFRYFSIGR